MYSDDDYDDDYDDDSDSYNSNNYYKRRYNSVL